jgi:hypothetical protein
VELQLLLGLSLDHLGELIAVAWAAIEQSEDDHFGATLLNMGGDHICAADARQRGLW